MPPASPRVSDFPILPFTSQRLLSSIPSSAVTPLNGVTGDNSELLKFSIIFGRDWAAVLKGLARTSPIGGAETAERRRRGRGWRGVGPPFHLIVKSVWREHFKIVGNLRAQDFGTLHMLGAFIYSMRGFACLCLKLGFWCAQGVCYIVCYGFMRNVSVSLFSLKS